MARVSSARPAPQSDTVLTLGFCIDRGGEATLAETGIDPKLIWMRGRQAESLDWAVSYFRGRPGVLRVANDLRVFGPTRKEIYARMTALHKARIAVHDVRFAEFDNDPHGLVHRTLVAMSAASGTRNHRTARTRGARGGEAKGASAWLTRNEIAPRWLIQNMVAMFGAVKTAAALDNKISASTLRRQYVAQPST